jgi:hypothetical protein
MLCAVLARPRNHLDRGVHRRVLARKRKMTNGFDEAVNDTDVAPSDGHADGGGIAQRVAGYLTGL